MEGEDAAVALRSGGSRTGRRRLARQDWINAALTVTAESGLQAVAIEPLALTLGATKGSFYWHFKDRAALIDALLEAWRSDHTGAVIADVEAEPGDQRVARLLLRVMENMPADGRVERAILAASSDPQVAPVVQEVHRARLDYLQTQFERSGLNSARAEARARIIYAAYLGSMQLDGAGMPSGSTGRSDHREELLRMLDTD